MRFRGRARRPCPGEMDENMSNKKFSGIMVPLVTPIAGDLSLNRDVVKKLVDLHLSNGVTGFYVCGYTGEGGALPEKTRMDMTEAVIEDMAGRGSAIIHVGAAKDTDMAIRLAKHAEKAGAQALSAMPPAAIAGDEGKLLDFFRTLSSATVLPFLVYAVSFPQANIAPFMQSVMEMENVIGLKFTRQSYIEMWNIIEQSCGDINVFNGPDETLICGLMMGADGGIGTSYNLMSGMYVELYNSFKKGDYERALEIQFKVNRVCYTVKKYGELKSVKHILRKKGYDVGYTAEVDNRLSPESTDGLEKALKKLEYYGKFY